MAKFLIRKLGSRGDACVAVAERELARHLKVELRQYSAAIRVEEGVSTFVGNDLGQVMQRVEGEVARGAAEVEVLLIPPVAGGQPGPGYIDAIEAQERRGGEFHVCVDGVLGDSAPADGLLTVDHIFDYFGELELGEVRLFVDGYRGAIKKELNLREVDLHDFYEVEHRQAYLGVLNMGPDRQFYLDDLKLGEIAVVRKLVEVCGAALWGDRELTADHVKELAGLTVKAWQATERRSLETLRRILGDEAADQLLRDGKITVKSADGREYTITDSGDVFYHQPACGRLLEICAWIDGEERLPKYDRVLAKYLVIRDRPEQIRTPQDLSRSCYRCGREFRVGDTFATILFEKTHACGLEEGFLRMRTIKSGYHSFCNKCYEELSSAGAFGEMESLLTGTNPHPTSHRENTINARPGGER